MKRISFLYFFSIISSAIQAQINTSITILKETSSEMIVEMTLGTIQQSIMPTEKGNAVQIVLSGCSYLNEKGAPALPVFSKSIIIPNQANASIQLLESDYEEYNNTLVAPSKGKYTRATDVSAIPFTFGQTYTRNEFYPSQQIALHDPFIFRDFRGQAIQFFPVQYNPVLGKLKVYRKIKVAIHFKEQALQNELHTSTNNGKVVDEFDAMYRNTFLNYAKKETRYSPISEIGSMLIVCPSIYLNSIAPFIKWKEMKGIQTFVVNTDTLSGGVTENTILNVASTYYQQKHIAYMLIVGDNTNIPARNENNNSSFLFGPSDMGYAYQAGNDHRPEFIVGRFSGENVVDIETQVQRTIAYEKNPNTIGNWMGTQIGIGSSICPSAGQATDDNQCDYEQIHDIVDSNKNQYNYVNNVELYDGVTSKGGTDLPGNPTTSMLLNAINDGASLINYSGHGATDGIITCQFATSNVPSISNANELPFFLVVGCRPGNFINTTSFSEALVRLGGSTPKGLISCFMSTVDQWIDAPMEVQDEFNAIMRGARLGNVKNRLGAMCVSGTMAMIDKYDIPSDPFGGSEMGDTWVFFGDPSVSLFNKFEGTLSVSNTAHVYQNQTFLDVWCPVDGATIGLYYQGKYLSTAIVNGGVAHCTFPAISGIDTIFVTATKQNYAPASSTSLTVDWALSTQSELFLNQVNIYPNPSTNFVNVESKQAELIEHVTVRDLTGRIVIEETWHKSKGTISLVGLSNALYFIETETTKGKIVSKFIKKN